MLIRFKNKMTTAIISMIEKGKAHGGLPASIEISVEEAQNIIQEINSLRGVVGTEHQRYNFSYGEANAKLSFIGKTLTDDEKFKLLTDWTEQKVTVAFDGVPIIVIITMDDKVL